MYRRLIGKYMLAGFVAMCLGLLFAGTVHAQGVFNPSKSSIALSGETIMVPANATIGQVLWTSPAVESDMKKGTGGSANPTIVGGTTSGPNGTYYQTNIPGIGLRWRLKARAPAFSGGYDISVGGGGFGTPGTGITTPDTLYKQTMFIEVVKTADRVANGTLTFPAGDLFIWRFNCPCTPWNIGITGNLKIEAIPTCSVQVPHQTVDMRTVQVSTFTGQNSTSEPKPFSIDLTCTGGAVGSKVNAYVTLTDSNAPGNQSKVLTLTGPPRANGIGIQIKHKDTILGYGPDSGQIPNTNQWFAGSIMQGPGEVMHKIPLTASYVQTAAATSGISAGAANAKATFNVTYN